MHIKEGLGTIARNSVYGLVDKETRAKNRIKLDIWEKESQRRFTIHKGVCPSCGGSLTRGRRNKLNDYKREWGCSECFTIHMI